MTSMTNAGTRPRAARYAWSIAGLFVVAAIMPGDLSARASSSRPALILPGTSASPPEKDPPLSIPAWPDAPRIEPLGPAGGTVFIPGLTGATLVRIAERVGCPVPDGLARMRNAFPVDPLTCIDRELGIGLAQLGAPRRASLLGGISKTIAWQDQLARKNGQEQPFIPPFRAGFGRVTAAFTSNIYQRIGTCGEAVVSWRLHDPVPRGFSQDNIAAGHTAPLAAYRFRQRDIQAMLASSPAKIRSESLPHAVCTRGRPETVEIRVGMGERELATFSVPATDFFAGGTTWAAHVARASGEITRAANERIRKVGQPNFAKAEQFRKTYGDFKNVRLMMALIDGVYRPKDFLPAHQLAVRRMLVRYHVLYSRHCYDDPGEDLTTRERTMLLADRIFLSRTFVYTQRNARTGEDEQEPQEFHIRARYADRVYELAQQELKGTRRAYLLDRGIEIWTKAHHDIDLFFSRQGCLSSRAASFEENLFQAASLKWDPQRERGTPPQIFIPGINLK